MNVEPRRPGALRTVLAWQVRDWVRHSPGRVGIGVFLAVPGLLALPIDRLGLFAGWMEGARVLLGLGAFVLAATVGRDTARPRPEEVWLFQKGVPLPDWALGRWLAQLAGAGAVLLWWVALVGALALLRGEAIGPATLAAIWIWLLLLFGLASSFLFLVGAAGSDRGVDLLLFLGFLSLLRPLLESRLPSWMGALAAGLLPPFLKTGEVRAAIALGEPVRVLVRPALHVSTYGFVLLAIGLALLARRRPDPR